MNNEYPGMRMRMTGHGIHLEGPLQPYEPQSEQEMVNQHEKALTEEERENLLSLLPLNCSKCDAYLLELKQIGSLKIKIDGKGGGTVMAHCFECLVKELEAKIAAPQRS